MRNPNNAQLFNCLKPLQLVDIALKFTYTILGKFYAIHAETYMFILSYSDKKERCTKKVREQLTCIKIMIVKNQDMQLIISGVLQASLFYTLHACSLQNIMTHSYFLSSCTYHMHPCFICIQIHIVTEPLLKIQEMCSKS